VIVEGQSKETSYFIYSYARISNHRIVYKPGLQIGGEPAKRNINVSPMRCDKASKPHDVTDNAVGC
jgi:hypothetical protein